MITALIIFAVFAAQVIGYAVWRTVDTAVTDFNARQVRKDMKRISGINVAYRGNDRHGDSYRWLGTENKTHGGIKIV